MPDATDPSLCRFSVAEVTANTVKLSCNLAGARFAGSQLWESVDLVPADTVERLTTERATAEARAVAAEARVAAIEEQATPDSFGSRLAAIGRWCDRHGVVPYSIDNYDALVVPVVWRDLCRVCGGCPATAASSGRHFRWSVEHEGVLVGCLVSSDESTLVGEVEVPFAQPAAPADVEF